MPSIKPTPFDPPYGGGGGSSPFVASPFSQSGGYMGGMRGDGFSQYDPRRRNRAYGMAGQQAPRNSMFGGQPGQMDPYGGMSNAQMGYSNWGDPYGQNRVLADMAREGLSRQGGDVRASLAAARAHHGFDPSGYGFAALQSQIGGQQALTDNMLRARSQMGQRVFQHGLDKDMFAFQQDYNQPDFWDSLSSLGGAALGGWAQGGFKGGGQLLRKIF